jgi:HD-GYP domain-containing protein (c-di-GMP phosphodiesterase class II)
MLLAFSHLPLQIIRHFRQTRLKFPTRLADASIRGNYQMLGADKHSARGLLDRIVAFRQRLEGMKALISPSLPHEPKEYTSLVPEAETFRFQLRQIAGPQETAAAPPNPQFTDRARRMLATARQLLERQRAIAANPFLGLATAEGPDLLIDYHRETIALAESAIRLAQSFSNSPLAQLKQCEGPEGLLAIVQERLIVQERTLARRQTDAERIDRLAAVYAAMSAGTAVSLTAIASLAEDLLEDARNVRPLRFVHASVDSVAAHPGAVSFPAPARYLAAHAVNVAQVIARLIHFNMEWGCRPLLAVVGALLIDCGMTTIPVATLARPGSLTSEERRLVDAHAQAGAEQILRCFPEIAPLASAVGSHHERADGTGYPAGLRGTAIPELARLLAVADVYAALNENRPYRSARDARAALTEVLLLAEHGLLDRESASLLVRLSFYPVGAVVELTDGRAGVVVANHPNPSDPRTPGRPVVAVLSNPDDTLLPHPEHIDLATADRGGILRSLSAERRRKLLGTRYPDLV